LEETAQTIYKQWFVDFEFPDENGKGYKSNGGEMVESEMGEVPKGWRVGKLSEFIEITSGKMPQDKNDTKNKICKYPIYGAGGIMGYSSDFLFNEKLLSMGRVGTHGIIQRINFACWLSDNTLIVESQYYEYVYQLLLNINYDEINRGGVQGLITQTDIKNVPIYIPSIATLIDFEKKSATIFKMQDEIKQEKDKLEEIKELLLAKMIKGNNPNPKDSHIYSNESI
jgi:type I restriction enzyme S subunit